MVDEESIIPAPAPRTAQCVKCGAFGVPRGSWSRFHCEPCDIERMHQQDRSRAIALRIPGIYALGRDHFVAESARLRAAKAWT